MRTAGLALALAITCCGGTGGPGDGSRPPHGWWVPPSGNCPDIVRDHGVFDAGCYGDIRYKCRDGRAGRVSYVCFTSRSDGLWRCGWKSLDDEGTWLPGHDPCDDWRTPFAISGER